MDLFYLHRFPRSRQDARRKYLVAFIDCLSAKVFLDCMASKKASAWTRVVQKALDYYKIEDGAVIVSDGGKQRKEDEKRSQLKILFTESALASEKLRTPFLLSGKVRRFVNSLKSAHKAYFAENLGRQIKRALSVRLFPSSGQRKKVSIYSLLKVR